MKHSNQKKQKGYGLNLNLYFLLADDPQENFTYMDFDFSKQKDKKLLIRERTQLSIVRYDEITYLECDDKLVYVHHMKYDQAFCYTKSLSELECELNQFGFLRIHNNKVVNMQHVLSLNSKKREIRLSTLEILTASRRKWQKVKSFFNN